MLITALMLVTGVASWILVGLNRSYVEIRGSNRFVASQQALYLSEAGVDSGIAWLSTQGSPPACVTTGGGTACLPVFTSTITTSGGTYRTTVTPDIDNLTMPVDHYLITATGTTAGVTTARTLQLLVSMDSFARFAYFSNAESAPGKGTIWFTSNDVLEGPVHTNDQFHITGDPVFNGPTSSVADQIDYYNGGPPDDNPVFQEGVKLGVEPIQMPDPSMTDMQAAASVVYTGNTTVTMNGSDLQVTNGGLTQSVPLSTCKELFVTGGDLTITGGTLNGQLTLVTDRSAYVNDSVTYACNPEDPEGDADCLDGATSEVKYNDDVLGIVAKNDVMISENAPDNVTIHGTVMAITGSFGVEKYQTIQAKGTLKVYGGIIQNVRGAVGTWKSTGSDDDKASGYAKNYQYDKRLLTLSPPNYPTYGKYKSIMWQEQ